MKKLIIIPARAGSKGVPKKNIKLLGGKPLILRSIEFAKVIAKLEDVICVSTDDASVLKIAKDNGIFQPFTRPSELSTDSASIFGAILHAINFYKKKGIQFDIIILLQPTSPFRDPSDYLEMEKIYLKNLPDMVVSVKMIKDSPYFNLFQEEENGFLTKFFNNSSPNRQDHPPVYGYNGSIYLFNYNSFLNIGSFSFDRIMKFLMSEIKSIDIDTPLDWAFSEFILENNFDETC